MTLRDMKTCKIINKVQSINVKYMTHRLLDNDAFVKTVRVLLENERPTVLPVAVLSDCLPHGFGEQEVRELCRIFRLDNTMTYVSSYRDFIDSGGKMVPEKRKRMFDCVNTMAISSSEAKRGFSQRNSIITDVRNGI